MFWKGCWACIKNHMAKVQIIQACWSRLVDFQKWPQILAKFRIASQQVPVLNLSMPVFMNRDVSTLKAVQNCHKCTYSMVCSLYFLLQLKILYTAKAFLNFPVKAANVLLFRTLLVYITVLKANFPCRMGIIDSKWLCCVTEVNHSSSSVLLSVQRWA